VGVTSWCSTTLVADMGTGSRGIGGGIEGEAGVGACCCCCCCCCDGCLPGDGPAPPPPAPPAPPPPPPPPSSLATGSPIGGLALSARVGVEEEEGREACDGGRRGGRGGEEPGTTVVVVVVAAAAAALSLLAPPSSSYADESRATEEGILDIASATAVRADEGEAAMRAAIWRSRRSTCGFFFPPVSLCPRRLLLIEKRKKNQQNVFFFFSLTLAVSHVISLSSPSERTRDIGCPSGQAPGRRS